MNKDIPPEQVNNDKNDSESSKKSSVMNFLNKPIVKADSRYMQYSGLGITLAVVILVFLWVGMKLDEWLNTSPWLTLTMTMLGFFGGFYNFFLNIQKLSKQDKEKNKLP
jgi:F0F1-type ATP synthase assembly protein I